MGDEVLWGCVSVGEVAASSAGDDNLATELSVALDNEDFSSATSGDDAAEKTRGTASNDHDVKLRFRQDNVLSGYRGDVRYDRP